MKCIVDYEDFNYAKKNDELRILNYLKLIGEDIKDFKTENVVVNSCSVNFGDYSVFLEVNITTKDILKISKKFNSFCQKQDWCDKKSLKIDEMNGSEYITWDSTISINPDEDDPKFEAFTEFDNYDNMLYITVKMDG